MTIEYKDSKRIVTNASSMSKSGCLAYYNFEQTGSTLTNQATTSNGYSDGVGSNADGTNTGQDGFNGATTNVTGKVSKCWDFDRSSDSSGDYVSGINLNLNGAGSISVWVNISLVNYGEIIGRGGAQNLVTYADGHVYYHGIATSAGVLSSNTWHHIVGTIDSSNNAKIYVDNVLVKSATGGSVSDATVEYTIGTRNVPPHKYYQLDGKIDELSVWSRELTTDEISALYNSGDGSTIDNTSVAQSKPTDVQDNSIMVEKDTARRYWFESGSSETLSQETESGTGELFNDVEIVGQKFTTGSSKIGKKVSSVAFYLKRNTSTIGSTNLQCFVGAGNQSSAVAYGTLPATSLTTSYAWYTFTPSVAGTERTLVADDRIMIRWADGSTTSDAVRMASDQSGNNPLANETGQYSADDGSNFTTRSFDYMYKIISTTPATWTMEPTYGTNFASSSGWTENTTTASDIDIQTASNRVYLNLTHNSSETSVLSRTLPTTSNTAWILRFKVNATSVGTDGSLLVGLSTNASASDTQQRFLGLWLKQESGSSIRAVTDNDNASGGLCSGGNNTSGYTGTTTTGTDYYVTVVRDVNNIKVTARTGSHTGTAVGSGTVITAVDGTATGLNTLKIMNHKCSTGGAWIGYLYDLEFYNGVTSIN